MRIDSNDIAKAKEAGGLQVKAATADKKKFDTILVEVISMVDGITLNHQKIDFENIGETIDLDYTIQEAIAGIAPYEDNVKWISSNSSIVSVDSNGIITVNRGGFASITATTLDGGHRASYSVSVFKEKVIEKKCLLQALN